MKDKIFGFGHLSSRFLIALFFYTGIIPIVYQCVVFGKQVYATHFVETTVKEGDWYTGKTINDLPITIFQGTVAFLVSIVMWKVICELLLIVVRYFETKSKCRDSGR